MIATAVRVELLKFEPQTGRTQHFFQALTTAARAEGVELVQTETYQGRADWLMLWGPGSPLRFTAMRQQRDQGKHVIAVDLAYWNRGEKVRVSIDAAHPQDWVMTKDWPTDRWKSDPAPVKDAWNPTGPVILAGLGAKARVQYGAGVVDAWEAEMVRLCTPRFSGQVLYRPKQDGASAPPGATLMSRSTPIDQALAGAALVVTWHSNVAVDAIRLGIPVVCQDGAAAAVCPDNFTADNPTPLPVSVRDRFLANLAWFQWGTTPREARGCWAFLRELLA